MLLEDVAAFRAFEQLLWDVRKTYTTQIVDTASYRIPTAVDEIAYA